MYLKKILDFYELDTEIKVVLQEQARSSAVVDHGMTTTLLDAASNAWKLITEETIRNAFVKADWKIDLSTGSDDFPSFDEVTDRLSRLDFVIDDQDIQDFITVDDEVSSEYTEGILEEVKDVSNEIQELQACLEPRHCNRKRKFMKKILKMERI